MECVYFSISNWRYSLIHFYRKNPKPLGFVRSPFVNFIVKIIQKNYTYIKDIKYFFVYFLFHLILKLSSKTFVF